MELTFPSKGWHTNEARFSQPEGTSPSLQNVLAFDRSNRSRGAQRPGTSKLYAAALGSGGQPVLGMLQVTRALDPSTITPTTQLLNYTFVQANGTDIGAINSGNDWRTSSGGASFFPLNTVGTHIIDVKSNRAITGSSAPASGAGAAIYKPTLTLGSAFIIKASVTFAGATGNNAVDDAYMLLCRINKSTFNQNGISLSLSKTSIVLRDAAASNINQSFTFASPITSGTFVLELRVNGNSFQGYVDGVLYVSGSTSFQSANNGVGLCIGKNLTSASVTEGLTNFQIYTGAPLAQYRQTNVVVSCGGNIYIGDISTAPTLASGGTGVVSDTIKTQMCSSQGFVYVTDGVHSLQKLVLSTQTIAAIVPTAGSETAASLGLYQLCCMWRDRLILAASTANPQNVVASRQVTHTDFDYALQDAAAAFAINITDATKQGSGAGGIGEPLNCLMPFSDDMLVLGADHSLFKFDGDPSAGGQVVVLSDTVGTMGPDCWDADPSGTIWFVGTTGFFKIPKGSNDVQDVSQGRINAFFTNINRATQYVTVSWDRDRNGCLIQVTAVNTGASTHVWYDAINDAFYPFIFPDNHGPITSITYDGDAPADRVLLLGGRDGFIRKWDTTAATDDGTAISSYVYIGPVRPMMKTGGNGQTPDEQSLGILQYLDMIFGEPPSGFTDADWNCQLDVLTGKDAYTAINSPERTLTLTFTASARRKKILQRTTGGVWYFKLSNATSGKIWQLEKLSLDFVSGGLQRRW